MFDEEFNIEELKTSIWKGISRQNLSHVDCVIYDAPDLVCELQSIQEFYDENKQNSSYLDFQSDTKYDKISKVTSIEANSGLSI